MLLVVQVITYFKVYWLSFGFKWFVLPIGYIEDSNIRSAYELFSWIVSRLGMINILYYLILLCEQMTMNKLFGRAYRILYTEYFFPVISLKFTRQFFLHRRLDFFFFFNSIIIIIGIICISISSTTTTTYWRVKMNEDF